MGRFSTTVHIKNNADREGFIGSFCEVMKKRGFVPCSEDEAAVSYLLAFGGEWVTLALDEYSENPQKAYDDARDISAEIKSSGFSVEVVDSDFAVLKLFGENKDEVIVGDGEGYGIEDAPKGDRKCWEPLLAEGGTWEQLSEIREKREVFVEDALWNAAPVLGITPEYMTADHRELSERLGEDENIREFFFKKADEKKKSMTLNAAFIKVFGEGLEPLGFKRLKKIKNKYPYFVRVIGDEILNIISYRQTTSPKLNYKCIEILGGIATLYRRNIDFSMRPEEWLINPHHLFDAFSDLDIESDIMEKAVQYECDIWGTDKDRVVERETLKGAFGNSISWFLCKTDDSEKMIYGLENAFNAAKSIIVGVFDKVTDLSSCVDYFYKAEQPLGWLQLCNFDEFITNDRYSFSEGLILIKTGYRDDGIERIKKEAVSKIPSLGYQATPENIDKFLKEYVERQEDYRAAQLSFRNEMLDNPELNKRVMEELERCKAKNIELLKSYGISINEE